MVFDFLKGLGRSRVTGVEATVQAKKFGAVAKAKGKVANKFNQVVDAPVKAAKKKAKGGDKDQAEKPKGEKMGLFGRKKRASQPQQMVQDDVPDGMQQTRAFNIDEIMDAKAKEVVGWLVALNGELKGRDFRITPGKNVIGTAANSDIVLTDKYMSSRHATINYENMKFTLVDLDSTNGTFVNDKRVSREELIDNDRVRLGKTDLKFKSLY